MPSTGGCKKHQNLIPGSHELKVTCALGGKTQKLRELSRGGAGWSEPLLKWVEINQAEKLEQNKETLHIWGAQSSLEQEVLTETPTKKFKCVPS